MKPYLSIGALILSLVVMPPAAQREGSSPRKHEDLKAKLHMRVHDYKLTEANFVEALMRMSADFQIPLGIEWVNSSAEKAKLNLSWREATAQEIVEAVVKTQPEYQMQVRNGVVHVFPARLIPSRQNFLKVRVNRFAVNDVAIGVVLRKLRDLVKLTVSPPTRRAGPGGGIGGSLAGNTEEPKVSLELSNVNVEDVLDKLATTTGRKIWIVTFANDSTLTPTGFRRILTLWNNFPIPDQEQPVWDMFRWGDTMLTVILRTK